MSGNVLTGAPSAPRNRSDAHPDARAVPATAAAPWEPLAATEANAVLGDGGYRLRVTRRGERLVLVGRGAGTGIPLGSDPSWADLYRTLIRLRRTRRLRDAAWLYDLMRTLHAEDPPDAAPRSLPAERADVLPADNEALSRRCAIALTRTDGGVHFPAAGETACGGTLLRGNRAIRLLSRSSAGELDRAGVCRQLRGWSRLSRAIAEDPMLRMHCAAEPAPAAVVDTSTGRAALARVPEPAPRHPQYPAGTVRCTLSALLRPGPDGEPALLRQVLANRFEHREPVLPYFLEHFVRPLLRSFRLGLDTHRIGLFGVHEADIGFELSPELQATGRIVLGDYEPMSLPPHQPEITGGVNTLNSVVDALCTGFEACHGQAEQVRSSAERIRNEELRYLEPRTAELLRRSEPLHDIAHAVPAEQDAVLKGVLNRVQERTRARRWDSRLPRPVVVVDLDLCGLVPLHRIREAVRAVSGPRPGAAEGIVELAGPDSLPLLPTHAGSTWPHFLERSGLARRYPEVDWWAVYAEFRRAFHARSRERTGSDTVNAGLARFVWDVRDAGGHVVFSTGRRERCRRAVEDVLATAGVPDSTLLFLPDERSGPGWQLRVEKLRELPDSEVLAVFDGRRAHRAAVVEQFPGAEPVAVEVPGLAGERHPERALPDTDRAVATFETTPRPPGTVAPARLSNTHSLEELQVGALRRNRLAQQWAVRLSEHESRLLVRRIVTDVDRCAERTARTALDKFAPQEAADPEERTERRLRALHHVFTRKQFLKGSRSNYRAEHLRADVEPFLRDGAPIDVVLFGFPVKQCLNRLKALGPLPDLAELGALARLRELSQAVSAVHPPGVRFNILADGRHFRTRPHAITESYRRKLQEYIELLGITERTAVEEIDAVAANRLGPGLPAERAARISRHRKRLAEALRGFDITDNPLRTLDRVQAVAGSIGDFEPRIAGLFREMLMSLVYSVPVVVPPGADRISWSTAVYADVYNLTDPSVPARVREARAGVLRRAWQTVLGYLATLQVDEEFGYERMFPNRVRLTVTAGREGCLGFTYLGGSGLLPWQGTGVVDDRGHVAVDFAISLLDRGFVPVFSPLLGPRQPWMMVPAQRTRLDESDLLSTLVPAPRAEEQGGGMRLEEDFAARVRLRRG
ncbi:L-tyrosine/L-tryptophan isonitrile synthase family protein [Salinifilum ghardaiensis]